jgi:hypothetical protein
MVFQQLVFERSTLDRQSSLPVSDHSPDAGGSSGSRVFLLEYFQDWLDASNG